MCRIQAKNSQIAHVVTLFVHILGNYKCALESIKQVLFIAAYCCIRSSNSKGGVYDCHLECRQNQDHQAKHHQMQVLFRLRCTLLEILCWQSSYNSNSKDAAISLFSDSNPIAKNPNYSHSLHMPSTTYLYMSLASVCHKKVKVYSRVFVMDRENQHLNIEVEQLSKRSPIEFQNANCLNRV